VGVRGFFPGQAFGPPWSRSVVPKIRRVGLSPCRLCFISFFFFLFLFWFSLSLFLPVLLYFLPLSTGFRYPAVSARFVGVERASPDRALAGSAALGGFSQTRAVSAVFSKGRLFRTDNLDECVHSVLVAGWFGGAEVRSLT